MNKIGKGPAQDEGSRKGRPRIGLRRETGILFPVSTLLIVTLSAFTLVSYRNAIQQLGDERRHESERLVRALAANIGASAAPTDQVLRSVAPFARGVVVLDRRGRNVASLGDVPEGDLLAPLNGVAPLESLATGPADDIPGVIVAFAPIAGAGPLRYLRIDLPAAALDAQRRSLRILTILVVAVDIALSVLMLAFLRTALGPYDALIERARAMGGSAHPGEELEFLLNAVEQALVASAQPGSRDDIAALERALAPSLESGLLLLDQTGGVLALNALGARLLSVPVPSPGQALATALSPHRSLVDLLTNVVSTGKPVQRAEIQLEPALKRAIESEPRAGSAPVIGLTAHPLRRDDGQIRGFLVLFADLTEARRKDEESQLAESLERIGELAAGVAHELRNSLATLRGYLTLIERRPGEETVQDYLGEIRRETDQLQRVLEDFLAFARPGTARLEDVDLQTVVRRAVADPALTGARIEVDPASTGPAMLRGDSQLLERAVRNLVHNAAQAEGQLEGGGGPVRVTIQRVPGGIELDITDRGPGLPKHVELHLFEPFVSGRPGGIGLGLALAYRIVDLHHGRIRLENRPGGGARARVWLPSGAGPVG